MKAKFKIIIADEDRCVSIAFKENHTDLSKLMPQVEKALLAWGFKPHHLAQYFNNDTYIQTLKDKINNLKEELKKHKSKVFSLPFSRAK